MNESRGGCSTSSCCPTDHIDPLFAAVVEATEESVLNALLKAETMTGMNGNTVYALPYDRLRR